MCTSSLLCYQCWCRQVSHVRCHLQLPKHKSQRAETFRRVSPPPTCHMSCVMCHVSHIKTVRKKLTLKNKSCIQETTTLSTDADSRSNTNLKRLRDLSNIYFFNFFFDRLRNNFLFFPCPFFSTHLPPPHYGPCQGVILCLPLV